MISVVMNLSSFDVHAGNLTFNMINHLKFKVVQQTFDLQGGPAGISVHMMFQQPGSFSPQSTLRVGWFVDGVSRVFNLQFCEIDLVDKTTN
jgi:hypothetical protein